MDQTGILLHGEETIKEVDEMFDLGGAFDGAGCGLVLMVFFTGTIIGSIFIIKSIL